MSAVQIEIIGEPVLAPCRGQADSLRALARTTTPRRYVPGVHVAYAIVRNQGIEGGWVVRMPFRTLHAARVAFATTQYP